MTEEPLNTSAAYPKVGGAFAYMEAPFAVHPRDNERAFEYLLEARRLKLTWADAERDIRAYLRSKGVSRDGIDKEVDRARPALEPWLG